MEYGGKGNVRKRNYEIQVDLQIILRKNAYLICSYNPTFHLQIDVQGMNVYQSLEEKLTKLTFLGREVTLVTAAIIIAKSFKFNRARELMEEQFSQLVEEKYAYVSKGKQEFGRKE